MPDVWQPWRLDTTPRSDMWLWFDPVSALPHGRRKVKTLQMHLSVQSTELPFSVTTFAVSLVTSLLVCFMVLFRPAFHVVPFSVLFLTSSLCNW